LGELLDSFLRELAKALVGQVAAGRGDDPVALRQQPGLRQAEQARQELAAREIACAAEEDDDVIVRDKVLLESHGHPPGFGSATRKPRMRLRESSSRRRDLTLGDLPLCLAGGRRAGGRAVAC
jgi:hypothetical protein